MSVKAVIGLVLIGKEIGGGGPQGHIRHIVCRGITHEFPLLRSAKPHASSLDLFFMVVVGKHFAFLLIVV